MKTRSIGMSAVDPDARGLGGAMALASYYYATNHEPRPWIGRVHATWTVGLPAFLRSLPVQHREIYRRECPGCGHRDQVLDWTTQSVSGHELRDVWRETPDDEDHSVWRAQDGKLFTPVRVWSCAP